ncbi:hypothetical protein SDC9_144415 [bioreactor metagenome]|uniref:Uncharacterized protein n=1 Tax=bioreactor metagenome TaxID=1076179 RepID=A0A645E9C6_9ZZZZ
MHAGAVVNQATLGLDHAQAAIGSAGDGRHRVRQLARSDQLIGDPVGLPLQFAQQMDGGRHQAELHFRRLLGDVQADAEALPAFHLPERIVLTRAGRDDQLAATGDAMNHGITRDHRSTPVGQYGRVPGASQDALGHRAGGSVAVDRLDRDTFGHLWRTPLIYVLGKARLR